MLTTPTTAKLYMVKTKVSQSTGRRYFSMATLNSSAPRTPSRVMDENIMYPMSTFMQRYL